MAQSYFRTSGVSLVAEQDIRLSVKWTVVLFVVNSLSVSCGRATKHCCKWQCMRQSCHHCLPVVVNCSKCEDSLTVLLLVACV